MMYQLSYFNSHPHEEDDEIRLQEKKEITYFNSHPHEEDDYDMISPPYILCISTHILTKRMTKIHFIYATITEYFNSHPHEEDD